MTILEEEYGKAVVALLIGLSLPSEEECPTGSPAWHKQVDRAANGIAKAFQDKETT